MRTDNPANPTPRLPINVKPTFKGPDSIITGIDILKRFRINVTKRSVNLMRELKNYKWKEDAAGKPLNVPVDRFNHGIDALRYVVMDRNLAYTRKSRAKVFH